MKNLAFIYQEHYLTNCARVACNKQRGVNNNFVIIECGYSNGLYSWKPGKESTYDVYDNNGCMCWCVPMSDLTKVKELKDIPEKEIKDQIKKDQLAWWRGEIKNGRAHKTDNYPDYFFAKKRSS